MANEIQKEIENFRENTERTKEEILKELARASGKLVKEDMREVFIKNRKVASGNKKPIRV
jgi:hypothetical protein